MDEDNCHCSRVPSRAGESGMIRETLPDGVKLERFESMTEFYRHCERLPSHEGRYSREHFFGHQDPREAARYCESGLDERHMRRARELVNKIDASFRDREHDAWHPAPMGAYAVVPEYLAGEPFPMRMRAREENDRAPIRYYIECVISAGVKLDELEARAAAMAALIMRSVEERSIELYALLPMCPSGSRGYFGVIPIQTHPIDLHSTIAAFATREFCRAMSFAAAVKAGGGSYNSIRWLYGNPTPDEKGHRAQQFRKALNMEPQDILMQGGYLSDARLFHSDPVRWVHEQIEKQRTMDQD